MWFSFFAVVLILAMTFYQGLTGLFSAAITCILTVLSAALAFGLHEDLYNSFLVSRNPDRGAGIALVSVFVIALLLLRNLYDRIITGNLHFPVMVDRIGGGVFGFVTSMIIVGVLAAGTQMLGFPTSFLGFSRFDLLDDGGNPLSLQPQNERETLKDVLARADLTRAQFRRRNLWLSPDGFTVGLVSYLSGHALAGQTPLADVYPDFLGRLHRGRYNPLGQARITVPPDSLRLAAMWKLPEGRVPDSCRLFERVREKDKDTGKTIIRLKHVPPDRHARPLYCRLSVDAGARDDGQLLRFSTEQIRLVGRQGRGGPVVEYYPAAISDENISPQPLVLVGPAEGHVLKAREGNQFDVAFLIPGEREFEPLFIEYKMTARVPVEASRLAEKPPTALKSPDAKPRKAGGSQAGRDRPTGGDTTPPPDGGASRPPTRRQDRVSGVGPAREARFSDELPFTRPLTAYSGRDVELRDQALEGGYVMAELGDDGEPVDGDKQPVSKLAVPANMRLLQLSVEKLKAESWLGNIYSVASDNLPVNNLKDADGREYPPVGAYAIAVVDGKQVFELRYFNEFERSANARLPRFQRIRKEHLGPGKDYIFVFLFHLPPGARPQILSTGRQAVELGELNLVAPE